MKAFKLLLPILMFAIFSCKNEKKVEEKTIAKNNIKTQTLKPAQKLSQSFRDYWYAGEAEISSYELEQVRYGEIRDGKAVLVFVTEDFLPKKQVKANNYSKDNIPVLKLNATKNFNTGIYPYSIMQSTFYPVDNNQHALKVSASIQEWCGHVYAQLNNRADFEIMSHSYFQSEADQNLNIEKAITENELWTQLRISPRSLPTGNLEIIPSLEYLRLKHKEIKAYNANAELKDGTYKIDFTNLGRKLTINYNPEFPHEILSWEDTYKDGYGTNAKSLTTKATKIKTIKSAYWGKNANADETLRTDLGLQ